MEQLPDELIVIMAQHLDFVAQFQLKQCCRRFYSLFERHGIPRISTWTSMKIYYTLRTPREICPLCLKRHYDKTCDCTTRVKRNYTPVFQYFIERKNKITNEEERYSLCTAPRQTEYHADFGKQFPRAFDFRTLAAVIRTTSLVRYKGRCPEVVIKSGVIPNLIIRMLLDIPRQSKPWSLVIRSRAVELLPDTLRTVAIHEGLQRLAIRNCQVDVFSSLSDEFFATSCTHLKELDIAIYMYGSREALYMRNITDKSIAIWSQRYRQIRLELMAVTNCSLKGIVHLIKCILEKKTSLSKYPLHFGFVCVPFSSISNATFPFAYNEQVKSLPGRHRNSAIRELSVKDKISFGIIDSCCCNHFFLLPCAHGNAY